ncbi:MAG TPA: hypothetical protein ENJ99_05275 [Rhizobiales bacterium]|nr:hypothetical protein [Hyphomicrobiales bacterium]
MTLALLGATLTAAVAATAPAEAGGRKGDYASEYCQFYKNRAMWTGDQYWWDRYYACLAGEFN